MIRGIQIAKAHELFGAEISGVDFSVPQNAAIYGAVRDALTHYGVVVIREQTRMDDESQIEFSQHFGTLQTSITLHREDTIRRMQRDELTELSNIDAEGNRVASNDTKRRLQLPGRLWHSDNSFRSPPGLFTFLHARVVPPVGGQTEFADMRIAYEELSDEMKARLQGLKAVHSLARSRELAGAPALSPQERGKPAGYHPAISPRTSRNEAQEFVFIVSCEGYRRMSEADGRTLLEELTTFATQERFIYSHKWTVGDLVIWDNRCTMHRATPFPEEKYSRDMRRTSVADTEVAIAS